MNNKTPQNIITILSTTSENKIKALRKAKGFSPSRLAKQAKIDKEQLLVLESSRPELITSELSKIAKVLQVDDDLLLDGAAVLPSADLRQLNYIFMQQKQKADISLLQTQILNWAVVLLHNARKEWENMRASSFAVIAQMDRKQNQTSLTPQQNQMQNSFAFGNNNQNQMMTNNNSQAKQTPSNNLSGNNNGLNNNFNNNANNNPYAKLKQWLGQSEQNINSALYPKPQGDDANSYQTASHKLIAF